jgi:4-hydroxy-3-polyprenylbenzoate decarboxylase
MAYKGMSAFISDLEKVDELQRITTFVDPVLEIAEIADRISKSGGKTLLFENNGTAFPVLINAFGSDNRMAMALGRCNLDEAKNDIERLLDIIPGSNSGIFKIISSLPALFNLAGYLPSKKSGKGTCQQIVHLEPDLGILPILKCWPLDGGCFITLPMVHTIHPITKKVNVGMYRMQVLDKSTTGMHWQRHKTGANHYTEWKKTGKKMPVTVTLGGDPVYTYCATAPLPENINEYILAGFLRKKRVNMVKCLTNELFVPDDVDIVIEGYVDVNEDLFLEGPFGDHTGFYSLADWYPKFHVTCITHSKVAVYPATVVGIPPQEDSFLAKATEKLFLTPVKMTLQSEIIDFHMPIAGVAHNLLIVKINKSYPGQGLKIISSLSGTGQMMFTKYLVVIDGDVNIRNYKELLVHVFENVDISYDMVFTRGPLDILDHSSDTFSYGGKAGIDATVKMPEELFGRKPYKKMQYTGIDACMEGMKNNKIIVDYSTDLLKDNIPVIIITINEDKDALKRLVSLLKERDPLTIPSLIMVTGSLIDPYDIHKVAWFVLGSSDPLRDHYFISENSILIDGTIKVFSRTVFPRKWPNIVCSDETTVTSVDEKWESLGLGSFIPSPSLLNQKLFYGDKVEISIIN